MKTLKKLALVFFILSIGIIPEKATAQNELQFSQVLTYTGSFLGGQYSTTYTVPSNKVWKVETISFNSNMPHKININDIDIYSCASDEEGKFFPIWLKAGDAIKVTASFNYNYFFSIIEYSVVAIQ